MYTHILTFLSSGKLFVLIMSTDCRLRQRTLVPRFQSKFPKSCIWKATNEAAGPAGEWFPSSWFSQPLQRRHGFRNGARRGEARRHRVLKSLTFLNKPPPSLHFSLGKVRIPQRRARTSLFDAVFWVSAFGTCHVEKKNKKKHLAQISFLLEVGARRSWRRGGTEASSTVFLLALYLISEINLSLAAVGGNAEVTAAEQKSTVESGAFCGN